MSTIREPRTIDAATKLAERFAEIEGAIGVVEAVRNDEIAKANARADEENAPLIEERDLIATKVSTWWGKGGREQALGAKPKSKSIELGGCILGERAGKATLSVAGKSADVIEQRAVAQDRVARQACGAEGDDRQACNRAEGAWLRDRARSRPVLHQARRAGPDARLRLAKARATLPAGGLEASRAVATA